MAQVPFLLFVFGRRNCVALFFISKFLWSIGVLILTVLVLLVIGLVKCRKNRDLKKRARSFKMEDNNVYGIYDDSGEMSDYTTVEDTNDYYGL